MVTEEEAQQSPPPLGSALAVVCGGLGARVLAWGQGTEGQAGSDRGH